MADWTKYLEVINEEELDEGPLRQIMGAVTVLDTSFEDELTSEANSFLLTQDPELVAKCKVAYELACSRDDLDMEMMATDSVSIRYAMKLRIDAYTIAIEALVS